MTEETIDIGGVAVPRRLINTIARLGCTTESEVIFACQQLRSATTQPSRAWYDFLGRQHIGRVPRALTDVQRRGGRGTL